MEKNSDRNKGETGENARHLESRVPWKRILTGRTKVKEVKMQDIWSPESHGKNSDRHVRSTYYGT
jgi:hypothetical protein